MLPHERPTDEILDNDSELDGWWERFVQERARSVAKAFGGQATASREGSMQAVNVPQFNG